MASSAGDFEVSSAVTDIEDIHRQAIRHKQSTYIDPPTGFTVFTELAHLKRGKCCGNQCRHCPYGWSNVRNEAGGFGGANDNARAMSGDREMTGRLVKRIMDGTYYEGEASPVESMGQMTVGDALGAESATNNDRQPTIQNKASTSAAKRQGKGGRAGGSLTSKNVPYTRKGDAGTSQLFTGERRSKDDILFEAMGTVDELCSIAGVVYAELNAASEKAQSDGSSDKAMYGDLPEQLLDVMSRLFDVGSHIAKPVPRKRHDGDSDDGVKRPAFNSQHTELLEEWIDTMTEQLPELTSFILPTGSPASAQLHVARTVCRRAERRMVPLVHDEGTVDPAALAYVNRLSDYFFTAARYVNFCDDRDELQYRSEAKGSRKQFQRERVVVKLKK